MLWVPDVSIRADVGGMSDDGIAIVLGGVTVPTGMPPPSKLAADPNIVDGAVPMVEHTVLPMMPVDGQRRRTYAGRSDFRCAKRDAGAADRRASAPCRAAKWPTSDGCRHHRSLLRKAWLHSSAEAVVIIRKCFMVLLQCRSSGRTTESGRSAQDLREGLSYSSAARAGRDAGTYQS
jgi:hypothetical protein